eukprot:jgi/Mesvir1/22168/Mv18770-RA.1
MHPLAFFDAGARHVTSNRKRLTSDKVKVSDLKQTETTFVARDRLTRAEVEIPKSRCRTSLREVDGRQYCVFHNLPPESVASSVVGGKGPLVLPESALARESGVLNHVICVDLADQEQLECLRRVFSREPSSREDKERARDIVAGYVNTRNCVPGCELKRPADVSFLMDNWSFTRTHVDFLSGEDTDETVFARLMSPSRLLIMYYPLSILDMAKNERIMTRDRYWYMLDLVPKSGEKLDHVYRNKQNIDTEDMVHVKLLRIRNPIPRAWGVLADGTVMEKPPSRKLRSRVSEQIMSP